MRMRAPTPPQRSIVSKPLVPVASRPTVVVQGGTRLALPDLRDPRRLREALIVKEILDVPLSRRPRR